MLNVFVTDRRGCLVKAEGAPDTPLPAEAIWLDLVAPAPEEERHVEALLGVGVPTGEEMQEIEISSRLYEENGALHDGDRAVQGRVGASGNYRSQLHSGARPVPTAAVTRCWPDCSMH